MLRLIPLKAIKSEDWCSDLEFWLKAKLLSLGIRSSRAAGEQEIGDLVTLRQICAEADGESGAEQCVESLWQCDLCYHNLNRKASDVYYADAVQISPVCSNSNKRLRRRIWGTLVAFEMFEPRYPCVISSPLMCRTEGMREKKDMQGQCEGVIPEVNQVLNNGFSIHCSSVVVRP